MRIFLTKKANRDLVYWKDCDPKKSDRILQLCADMKEHPFTGIGKPEPLKFDLQGYWSRRIDRHHRIVYRVINDTIEILSCRFHY